MSEQTPSKNTPSAFSVEVPTALIKQVDLLPWQVRYLAANIESKLESQGPWQTPDKDRNPGGYALTIHESIGQDFLGLIDDARRFYAGPADPASLGWQNDWDQAPTLIVQIANQAVSGPVVFTNSRMDAFAMGKTPEVLDFLLHAYIEADGKRPPEPASEGDLRGYIHERQAADKIIFKDVYNHISGIMRSR